MSNGCLVVKESPLFDYVNIFKRALLHARPANAVA
jgi:hypothetical protein